jgi:hypothetical protein
MGASKNTMLRGIIDDLPAFGLKESLLAQAPNGTLPDADEDVAHLLRRVTTTSAPAGTTSEVGVYQALGLELDQPTSG